MVRFSRFSTMPACEMEWIMLNGRNVPKYDVQIIIFYNNMNVRVNQWCRYVFLRCIVLILRIFQARPSENCIFVIYCHFVGKYFYKGVSSRYPGGRYLNSAIWLKNDFGATGVHRICNNNGCSDRNRRRGKDVRRSRQRVG